MQQAHSYSTPTPNIIGLSEQVMCLYAHWSISLIDVCADRDPEFFWSKSSYDGYICNSRRLLTHYHTI